MRRETRRDKFTGRWCRTRTGFAACPGVIIQRRASKNIRRGEVNAQRNRRYGLMGPQGLSRDVVDKLHATMSKALAMPENRKRFEQQGLDIAGGKPADLANLVREESVRWAKVVKASGAKAD